MPVDPTTNAIYDRAAATYATNRPPRFGDDASTFAAGHHVVADLGCGPGGYLPALGAGAVGVDASSGVLALAQTHGRPLVRADLAALPFRPGSVDAGWARNSYLHVPHDDLAATLADLHRSLRVGAPVRASWLTGRQALVVAEDDLPGRHFWFWTVDELLRTFVGAGFDVDAVDSMPSDADGPDRLTFIHATRARTLPDTVGPSLRLLICGLNPSVHAADAGVGFITPGNRFWPAALAAGLVTVDRDPWHALRHHAVGMTDVVKRATRRADELAPAEYAAGVERLDLLCAQLQPQAVCMVGLAGWRAAVDRRATSGWQPRRLGGRPVYVMPSTSGLNAGSRLDDLTEHLRVAAAGPD